MDENMNATVAQESLNNDYKYEEPRNKRKKKPLNILKIIIDIILFILLLAFIASAVIGYLNMQAINENKEPVWCMSESVQENKDQIKRTCDIGVFKIVKTESSKETVVSLKPFFIAD